MAVENRAQCGWIGCPMCQTRATVHQTKIGRGGVMPRYYWRCQCGTVQPYTDHGQRYIEAHAVDLDGGPIEAFVLGQPEPDVPEKATYQEPAAEPVAKVEPEPKPEPPRQRRGLLSSLADGWNSEAGA